MAAGSSTFVLTTTQGLHDAVDAYLADTSQAPPINGWDVSQITDFSELFSADRNPAATNFNADLNTWDTGNAVTMRGMFAGAKSFNGDVSTWNTGRVTSMKEMFLLAESFAGDVSGFDTSSVTDMAAMVGQRWTRKNKFTFCSYQCFCLFQKFRAAAAFNSPIGDWDTSNVQDMSDMVGLLV
jgi:surface protein